MSTASTRKPAPASGTEIRKRPLRLRIHTGLRWLHIYLSMFSLLLILFFAATGLTLNHPEWTFGLQETKQDIQGTLPAGWNTPTGTDWLKVADYLRATNHVHGNVDDKRDESNESSISFKGPGYAAECLIDRKTGTYHLTVMSEGFVNILNDLHRGKDTNPSWNRAIDVSAIFLMVISLTGLALLFYLKKMKVSGLAIIVVGFLMLLLLMKLAS